MFSTALPAIFSNTQKTERGFQMDNTNLAKSVSATSENNSVKKECSYNLMHTLFAILSLVMGVLYYNFVIKAFFGEYPQYLICIFTVVFCIFVWAYFFSQRKYITEQTLFFMAFTVAFSLRFAFYENTFDSLCFLSLFCVHIFALLSVLSASESLQMPLVDNIVSGTLRAMSAPYTKYFSLFGSFSALFHIKSEKVEKWKKSNAGNIGLIFVGLVISIPLALTVFSLLLSDAFFGNFTSWITDLLNSIEIDLYINPFEVFIVVVCALMFFGALYSADTSKRKSSKDSGGEINAIIGTTVMTCVSIIYLLFMLAQIGGFTCMAAGKLPENTTYAEFARSGFFELCAVACINGLILYCASRFCIEKEKGKVFHILCYTVCIFTLAIIAVAASKMIFYISAYGFTQKRFCTLWFMLLLAVLFSLAIRFFKSNSFRLSKVGTYVTVSMLLILFYVNWESLAANLNKSFGY